MADSQTLRAQQAAADKEELQRMRAAHKAFDEFMNEEFAPWFAGTQAAWPERVRRYAEIVDLYWATGCWQGCEDDFSDDEDQCFYPFPKDGIIALVRRLKSETAAQQISSVQ
jgi:hypothetical protein